MTAAHLLLLSLLFPLQNVPWVAGGNLNDIHDVKAVSLLLAMKQNRWKLPMGGLSSSFPPANTGLCLAKEACPEMHPGHLFAKVGLLQ